VQVPLEQIRQANEDLALMFQWFERIGTGVDVASLHKQYPEVNWLTFKDWVKSQLGRPSSVLYKFKNMT
jgi:hypothetical protein